MYDRNLNILFFISLEAFRSWHFSFTCLLEIILLTFSEKDNKRIFTGHNFNLFLDTWRDGDCSIFQPQTLKSVMLTQKYLGAWGKSEESSQCIASLLCSIAFYASGEELVKAFDGPFKDVVLLLYWQIKPNYFSKSLLFVLFI